MVPPSIHPPGDTLRWAGALAEPLFPTRITAAGLRVWVAQTASAALLARYWPQRGSRDEAALALTGWLAQSGWDDAPVARFVEAVAKAAGDEEWQKRASKAAHTRAALAAGKPTMGAKALAERLRCGPAEGAKVVAEAAGWLGLKSGASEEAQGTQYQNMSPLSPLSPLSPYTAPRPELVVRTRMGATLLSDVQPEKIEWLWEGRIPLGAVTMLEGDPGLGKSYITVFLAACVTTGRPLPSAGETDAPDVALDGGVVILSAEDSLTRTIQPRLLAAGGDPTRVLAIHSALDFDVDGVEHSRSIILPRDMQLIADGIAEVGAKRVIIDPLMSYLDLRINSWNDQHVRSALEPFTRLADETDVAFLILRHLNKSEGRKAIYRGGGSIGIGGTARAALQVGQDPEDPEHIRVLASVKGNLGPAPVSLRYRITPVGDGMYARVEWLGASPYTAESLLHAREHEGSGEPARQSELERACDLLRDFLASGPQLAVEGEERARRAGVSHSTLNRARRALGIEPHRRGQKGAEHWYWSLPATQQSAESDTETGEESDEESDAESAYAGKPCRKGLKGLKRLMFGD